MDFETLLVERSADGFATLVLNRPEKLNTLSISMRREMAAAIDALEADPVVRVLILTAGLDLDEWAAPGVVAAGAYEHDAVGALQRFSGPVIGAVNGLAVTGGVEIALACDVLIASTPACFIDTHVQVDLLPGWGGSVRMARRIGLHRAKELALTGRTLGPKKRSPGVSSTVWSRPINCGPKPKRWRARCLAACLRRCWPTSNCSTTKPA